MADPEWRARTEAYGPYLSLLVVFAFMVWVRLRPSDRVISPADVAFSGNDPWYHARIVHLTVRHFPWTPRFDPWSYFPYGTGRHSGFGGLFDQLIALASLIVGLGDPSPHLVEVVTAYAPAIFGGITVLPAYLVTKRLTDRWSGLLAALLLAMVNGQFLTRTVIGVSDHQSAEAFFGTLTLVGFIYAMETAYVEQPTRADIADRNWRVLRRPAIAGLLGGLAIAAYLMMWGPGVFLVFTLGVFVVIQLAREHYRGESTEFLAFATIISFLVGAVLTLAYAKSYDLSATSFSLLQPLLLFSIAVGALILWILSERFKTEGYERQYYPPAVGGLIFGSFVLASAVYPPTFSMFRQLIVRIYSFGLLSSPTALTVAEIAPATMSDAWNAYAGLLPIAALGFLVLAARVIRDNRPVELLVVLWSLTITSAYFTMIRFGYYFGVTVAILAAYAIWWTAKVSDLDQLDELADIETYQILVVLIVLLAVAPGNVVGVGGTSPPAWETADRLGGSNSAWQNELSWVNDNTPEIPLEYYGQYERPDDGDFEYPEGAYGVMSWWDYGHWITYTGERIPNANPFQQGPRPASAFLLAENETRANLILEALATHDRRGDIPEMSTGELRATVETQTSQQAREDTRYVIIDDQMAAGKFSAIATWTGPGPGHFFSSQEFQVGNSQARLIGPDEEYHSTMLARLYFQDARQLSHYRLVHETESVTSIVSVARQTPQGEFQTTSVVNQRLSQGVFTAVQQRPDLAFYDVRQASTVKTYERVPGATLTGQANTTNRTTVFATLQLRTNTGRNFTYVQTAQTDPQGNFEITVPYATTNTVGPSEGGTDSGVTALGRYQVFTGNPFQPGAIGNTSVPEPTIYDGETITVDLEPIEPPSENQTDAENGSNESSLTFPLDAGPTEQIEASGGLSTLSQQNPTAAEARPLGSS